MEAKANRIFVASGILAAVVLLSGCDRKEAAAPSARILVADLDAIARSLGRMDQINAQINQANQSLLSQRAQIAANLQNQVDEAKKAMGDKPTEDQQKELNQLVAAANQRMRAIDQEVQSKSMQVRQGLIVQFRDEAMPVAERIARERGATLVMTVTPQMLWTDPKSDITDEISEVLRSQPSSKKALPSALDASKAPAASAPKKP